LASIDARRVAGRLVVETAMKNPDVAIGRDVYADHLSPLMSIRTFHGRRKRRPILLEPVRIWKRGLGNGSRSLILSMGRRCQCDNEHRPSKNHRAGATCRQHDFRYFLSAAPDRAPFSTRNLTTASYLRPFAASSAVR